MVVDLVFLLLLLVFSILLNVIFYSKKHVDTKETRLFGIIAFTNMIGIFIEFSAIFTTRYLGIDNTISIFINRCYLIYLLGFILLFSLYVLNTAELSNNEFDVFYEKLYKIIKISLYVIFAFSVVGVCLLDVSLSSKSNLVYAYGSAVSLVYNLYAVCFLCCLIYIIRCIGLIKRSARVVPIAIFIIITTVFAYILSYNPGLLFIAGFEFLVVFTMYHSIENPDIKMLERLEIAKQEVEKANSAKTEFLSSMSHEIRTPLNSIVGFSDCLLDTDNIDEIKNNAKDIVNASESLLEVVNGILDVSKIDSGTIELTNSLYNSFDTFKSVADLVSPKMMGKGIDFSYYIAPDIPKTLYGDDRNIRKIISNLLLNACKYTDNGFIKYEVNCVNAINYAKLIISVEDSGQGIKRQDLDDIFNKYVNIDNNDLKSDNNGLGLAVIKQLVELMGGKIIVHSEYGKGSKFTVLINQSIAKETVSEEKKEIKNIDLTNVNILLVDDNNLNLKVSSKILEKYNANCITKCSSGFECLDLIKNGNRFDVIFLDDMMPRMSGVETLKKLKEIDGFNTPVVALTANAILGMKDKYIEAGFNDYLAKPINKNILVEVLNNVLIEPYSNSGAEVNKIESTDKYKEIIPVDDNFAYKVSSKMDLSSDKKEEKIEKEEEKNEETTYDEKYLEENGVDLKAALELLGDMDMYNSTVKDFLDEVDDKWNKIVEYKNSSDMENYAIEVHSLKSNSKYLGLMKLADVAYQHELKSKEKDAQYVEDNFYELENEYNKALEVMKKYNSNK